MTQLPTMPLLIAGEGYDSYLERLSAALQAPFGFVLDAVGLPAGFRAGWGAYLPDELIEDVADSLDLDAAEVRGMTLAAYTHAVTPPSALTREHLGLWACREWVHLGGSFFCPQHLADDGAWQLAHRIAVNVGCIEHGRTLADRCPTCLGWPHGGNGTSAQPVFMEQVRQPARCHRPEMSEVRGRGRGARPCGGDLRTAVTEPMQPHEAAWQHLVDTVLAGSPIRVAGVEIAANEGLRALREVLSLQNWLSNGLAAQPATTRFWRSPPRDLAGVRELVSGARRWAEAADPASASSAFVEEAASHNRVPAGKVLTEQLARGRQPVLREFLDHVLRRTGRPSSRLNRSRTTSDHSAFLADMPQLAWSCAVPADLHALRRPTLDVLRAYISLAVARTHTTSWADAARSLGLPAEQGKRWAHYVHNALPAADKVRLDKQAMALARELASSSGWTRPWPTRRLARHRLDRVTAAPCSIEGWWCPCASRLGTGHMSSGTCQ